MPIPEPRSFESLSVSKPRKEPRRRLTDLELATFARISDTLIPASGPNPAGSAVAGYSDLIHRALGILDKHFGAIVPHLERFAGVADGDLWDRLKEMSSSEPDDFYWLSTVVVGAYLYSPEMKAMIGYPVPHPNPAGMFEIVEELESGILDPVIERGPIYVSAD